MDKKNQRRKGEKKGDSVAAKRKPVWHDPDDDILDEVGLKGRRTKLDAVEGQLYRDRLKQNIELAYGPTPEWAQIDKKASKKESEDESGDEDETAGFPRTGQLSAGKINIHRVVDLNAAERKEGAIIRSVGFHPSNPVGLVAGSSGIVSLYQVDGNKNPLIQSFSFEDFPLRKAQFSSDGEEIYVSSGMMSHFYCYDMRSGDIRRVKPNQMTKHETIRNLMPCPDGKSLLAVGHRGQMYLFSQTSKEIIDTFAINSEVKDAAFSPDGKEFFVQGDTGIIYRWDMARRACVEKFSGEANFDGTSLAVSQKYIACGSSSGFVSIFDNKIASLSDEIVPCQMRKPLGELGNLQTVVTSLKINPSEEIMAMASVDKDNAIRLVHLPSRTTFPRFPFVNANYGRCNSISFSPNSGYLALGSNRGCAYLFRLKHYSAY